MSDDQNSRPIAWKFIFLVVLVVGIPIGIAIRVYWIPHLLGAMGVGLTMGYGVALALMWSGVAPRERAAPEPVVRTNDALVYFQAIGTTAWISVINATDAPLRIPGLADGVAAGLTVEVLEGGLQIRDVSLAPRSPPSSPILELPPSRFDFVATTFDPQRTPSGRTVRLDVANSLNDLPKGRYDLRWRWDLTPMAGEGFWTPGGPVVLGMSPLVVR